MKKGPKGEGRTALMVLSSILTQRTGFFSPSEESTMVNRSTEFPLATGFMMKYSKVKITSSAVKGTPSDHFTSLRRKVTSLPSGEVSHDSARPGLISLVTGWSSTRPVIICPMTV